MEFDPSCCAFQGKLHADRRTLEYVGRGNHDADAACFRTTRAAAAVTYAAPPRVPLDALAATPRLPVFYYETQVLATAEDDAGDAGREYERERDVRVAHRLAHMQTLQERFSAAGPPPAASPGSLWPGTRLPWRVRARRLIQSRIHDLETAPAAATTHSTGTSGFTAGAGGSAPRGVGADSEEMVWRFPSTAEEEDAVSIASRGRLTTGFTGSGALAQELAEQNAMDMEDVQEGAGDAGNGSTPGAAASGMHFAFTLSSRTLQQMRSRQERRRLRRSSERRRFSHRIAIGFSVASAASPARLDGPTPRQSASSTSEDEELAQDDATDASRRAASAREQRDLGQTATSLAYVGKTGRVVSNGREFLQCERYGAGDVVGCGLLLDARTFFFTLNGRLMGVLPASDVHHLDDFTAQSAEEVDADAVIPPVVDGEAQQSSQEKEKDALQGDVDMTTPWEPEEPERVLFPAVSLHDAGECVHAAFTADEFQFDLAAFEHQVQKERQRALLLDRETRRRDADEHGDDVVLDALVQDFFLHYGYESAYVALATRRCASAKRSRLSSGDGMNDESDEKSEDDVELNGRTPVSPKERETRRSLHLRHEVRELVRGFQTAQAMELLAKRHVDWGGRSRTSRQLQLQCRILCVVDVLVRDAKTERMSSGSTARMKTTKRAKRPEEDGGDAWNPELAIAYAQTAFDTVSLRTLGDKPKRAENGSNGDVDADADAGGDDTTERDELAEQVALAMSLLLYDRRENVPRTSLARRFLTSAFRESVADGLNALLLAGETTATTKVSQLETFLLDVDALQSECLRQGCRVFPETPESVASRSAGKRKASIARRHRGSSPSDAVRAEEQLLSSGSDDSSSTLPRSDQEDREEEEDDE